MLMCRMYYQTEQYRYRFSSYILFFGFPTNLSGVKFCLLFADKWSYQREMQKEVHTAKQTTLDNIPSSSTPQICSHSIDYQVFVM